MRVKRDWSKLLQPVLLPLAFIVGIGSFILVADGKTKKTTKPPPDAPPPSILMIGDSLSVGKFGEVVQMHLALRHRVAAYASCGSSPEHWLAGEPDFVTKCGYRQRTSDSDIFTDWVNGHAPRATAFIIIVSRRKPGRAASSGIWMRKSRLASARKNSASSSATRRRGTNQFVFRPFLPRLIAADKSSAEAGKTSLLDCASRPF